MLRKLILIPAALTSTFAAASLFFSLADPDSDPGRLVVQILSAAFIFAAAGLAGTFAFKISISESLRTWMGLAGIGLIALGLVGGIMAFVSGRNSGDFEYYLFLADALFIGQGSLHLLAAWWQDGFAAA
jgi:hypothetical protein